MWILEFRGEGQTYTGPAYYCLLEGCEYIVGRKEKEADIVLHFEADISISRKHAKIVTAPGSSSASESAAIRIADISKHGTILSGQSPLQPSELRSITVNDVILFGRSQALFRVQYRDFLVCFDEDSIEPQALEKAKNQLQKLGVFVVPAPALIACSNSKQSTTSAGSGHVSLAMLYVTQEIRITTRFLHALLYGYVPVTVSYIDTLYEKLRSSTAESLKLVPSAGSFFPATGSAALKPIQRTGNLAQLTLYPMKPPMNERDARSESNAVPALLSGFSFVFPSQELMATWSVILREVGATVYTMVLNVDAPVVVDLGISVPHDDTKDSEEPNTFVFLPDSLFIQYTNDPSSLPGVLGVAMRYGCAAAPESALLHLIYSRTDVRSILYRGSRSVRMLSFAERTTLPVPSATHPAPAGHYSRKNRDTAKSPDSMPDEVRSNDGTPDVNTNSLRVTHDDPSQLPPLEDEFNMAIPTGVLGSSQDTPHSTRLPTPISLSSVPSGIREHSAVQLHEPHYITPTKQTGVARSENNPNATSVNETTGANLNVRSPNPATGVVARSLKRNERGTSSMIVSPSNRATASLVPRRVSIGTTHIRATTPTGAPTVTGQTGTTSPGASVPQTAHAHLSSKLVAKVKAPSGGGLDSITTLCNDHERYLVRQCLTKLHEISERAEKRRYVTDVQLDFIRSVFQKNEKFLASLTQCIEQSEFDPTQPRHIDEITQMEASQSWNLCTSINRSIVTVIQKVNGDTSFADGSIALSPTTPTFVLHPATPQTNSGGAYPKVGETPHSAGEGTHRANITPRANATPERSIMRSRSRTQQSNTSSLAQRNTPSKRPFSPASRVVGRTGTPRSPRMDGFSKTSSIRGASPVLSARGSFPRRSFTPVSISRSVQSGGTAQGATSVAERTKNVLFPSSPKAPRLGAVRTFEKEAGVSECGSMFNGTTSVPPVGYSCVRANTPNARSSAQRSISATGSGRRGTPQKSRLREIENLTISNISNANNIGAIRELRNVYLNEFGEIHGDELFLKWFLSRPQTWLKDLTRALARRGMVPDDILRAPMKKLLEPDEIPARL